MSAWQVVRLIAGREIAERVRGRLIRILTLVTALLVVVGVALPGLIKSSSAAPVKLGLVGPSTQALAPAVTRTAGAAKLHVRAIDVADPATARDLLVSGGLDVALELTGADTAVVSVKQSLSASARAVLQAALDDVHLRSGLALAHVPLAKVLPALTPVRISETIVKPPAPDRTARTIAAIAAALLMYVSLGLYGGAVAIGVAQEKTSRTAEVLLAAVRPRQLLVGKVLGIGSVGLGQLGVAAAAGLIANAFVHSAKIPTSVILLLPAFLVCFLAGFALYAFALAAAGALVARQEELQAATLPVQLPLLIGYLLVYAAIGNPNAGWLKLLSFVPPLTATLMPARIALGHVAAWELPLAAVIMAASIYGMARLAARVYAGGMLHGGARLGWRAALRLPA